MKKLSHDLTIVTNIIAPIAVACLLTALDIRPDHTVVAWIVIPIAGACAVGSVVTVVIALRKDTRERHDVATRLDRMYGESIVTARHHLKRAHALHRSIEGDCREEQLLGRAISAVNDVAARLEDEPKATTSLVSVDTFSQYTTRFDYERNA